MRKHKFRVWDKIDKRLIIDKQDFIPLIVTNKGVFKLDPTCEYERWIETDKNRFDFMQYTGLEDKNDVEIYEGDIVQVDGLGVGIIEYIESYFRIFKPYIFSVNLCNYTSTIELEPKNKVEVIGNIYENPELLK